MEHKQADGVSFPNLSIQESFLRRLNKAPFQKGDLELLTDKVIPPRLLHREKEKEQVIDVVSITLQHSQASHLFVYGKTGTGKTAVVRFVVEEAAKIPGLPRPVVGLYVNCSDNVSHHALLRQLIEQLEKGEPVHSNTPAEELHSRFLKACQKAEANIVVILDEITRLVKRSGYDAMYSLSNMNAELRGNRSTVTIVAISNDLHFGERLDPAVQSRLSVMKLYFPPYNAAQLGDILRDRVQLVFHEGGLDDGIIELCSAYAAQTQGDARQALSLLRLGAVIASREGAHKISTQHIVEARKALEHDVLSDSVRKLTVHQKLVLYVTARLTVKRTGSSDLITSGRLNEEYGRICTALGVQALAQRSVAMIIDDLSSQGFIKADVKSLGRGKGRTSLIYLNLPTEPTIHAIQEDSIFDQAPQVKWKGGDSTLDRFGR